ncbi:MAG TPA: hypothetical protein VEF33_05715 [Syntrophales bacterium]|nr:hypothetical protein [Syntrophales bacterium]
MINYRIASILSFLIPILLFLLALLIIFKSEQIGTFLLRKDQVPTDEQSIRLSDTALNISIKVFGIYSILSSIPHIASLLSTYLVMRENVKYFDNQGMIKLASSGVSTILYVGVGIGLIFYSKALANKIMNIDSRTV